jgi:hypothetical protein
MCSNKPVMCLLYCSLFITTFATAQPEKLGGVWGLDSRFSGPESQWSSSPLPFTAAGRQQFDSNIPGKGPRAQMPALGNDPLGDANPPGLYRTISYDLLRPWEFLVLQDRVVQNFEWGKHWRTIWTDGRDLPDDNVAGPFWYGYSVGVWEDDTLVVQTNGLDGRQWLDMWGTPFSDFARFEERWTVDADDKLSIVLTVTDPDLYAETWTSDPIRFARQAPGTPNGEVSEQIFAPIDEEMFNTRVRDLVIPPQD